MKRPLDLFGTVLLLLVSLVACSRGAAPGKDGGTGGLFSSNSNSREGSDPCSLLEQADVEAVTGQLAGPPYRASSGQDSPTPVAGGDACVYETPDFRNIQLSVTWTDGATALKAVTLPTRIIGGVSGTAETADVAKNAAKKLLVNGIEIDGEWDEAGILGCCQIYALRGDSLIMFDYRGWRADTEHAAQILNKALLRLEKPLSADGNAGNDAAGKRASLRPAPRPACGLLSRAEVESVLGPLLAEPKPDSKDTEGCTYRFTQAESKEGPFSDAPKEFKSLIGALTGGKTGMVQGPVDTAISIRWRGGFRQLNDSALVSGAVSANFEGLPGMPKRTMGKVEGSTWDEAAQTSLNFTAVRKDVSISIDTEPMFTNEQVELRRRLVAKAIEKIPR